MSVHNLTMSKDMWTIAMLTMRGRGHFTDADVTDVANLAIAGLVQTSTENHHDRCQRCAGRTPIVGGKNFNGPAVSSSA